MVDEENGIIYYNKFKVDDNNHEADLMFDYDKEDFVFKYNDVTIVDGVTSTLLWISAALLSPNIIFKVYSNEFGNEIVNLVLLQTNEVNQVNYLLHKAENLTMILPIKRSKIL